MIDPEPDNQSNAQQNIKSGASWLDALFNEAPPHLRSSASWFDSLLNETPSHLNASDTSTGFIPRIPEGDAQTVDATLTGFAQKLGIPENPSPLFQNLPAPFTNGDHSPEVRAGSLNIDAQIAQLVQTLASFFTRESAFIGTVPAGVADDSGLQNVLAVAPPPINR